MLAKTIDFLTKLGIAIILDALLLFGITYVYYTEFSDEARNNKVQSIYKELLVQTGQAQDALPLYVVQSDVENAYTNGVSVVIYSKLIDNAENWDEVALVLAHEIAHGTLGHLNTYKPVPENNDIVAMGTNGYSAVLEGNADKMGAFYMMKAGYNICAGRQIYKRWKENMGDFQAQNHPDYAYRYAELNVNCGE